mmetsp:Transcript_24848/g.60261  ORF Transcript_24848/g.60261 Transcript_24848/m.60261 type:complete len:357 (-) Transcript_24848:14-1084(-)
MLDTPQSPQAKRPRQAASLGYDTPPGTTTPAGRCGGGRQAPGPSPGHLIILVVVITVTPKCGEHTPPKPLLERLARLCRRDLWGELALEPVTHRARHLLRQLFGFLLNLFPSLLDSFLTFLYLALPILLLLPLPLLLGQPLSLGLLLGAFARDKAAILDHYVPEGPVLVRGLDAAQAVDDVHPLEHPPKHHMLAVEPRRGLDRDEKLAVVCVCATVCHRQQAPGSVLDLKVLVREVPPVDALPSSAVALGDVSTLKHKVRNHPVEAAPLEVQHVTVLLLVPDTQRPEVLSCDWYNIAEELERHPPARRAPVRNVKIDVRAAIGCLRVHSLGKLGIAVLNLGGSVVRRHHLPWYSHR